MIPVPATVLLHYTSILEILSTFRTLLYIPLLNLIHPHSPSSQIVSQRPQTHPLQASPTYQPPPLVSQPLLSLHSTLPHSLSLYTPSYTHNPSPPLNPPNAPQATHTRPSSPLASPQPLYTPSRAVYTPQNPPRPIFSHMATSRTPLNQSRAACSHYSRSSV